MQTANTTPTTPADVTCGTPRYQQLASALASIQWMQRGGTPDERYRAAILSDELRAYVRRSGPSGSGIDRGTYLLDERSDPDSVLHFRVDFHHMNDTGYYVGWSEHVVSARASLCGGLRIHVSGRDHNDIKAHLADTLSLWLGEELPAGSIWASVRKAAEERV